MLELSKIQQRVPAADLRGVDVLESCILRRIGLASADAVEFRFRCISSVGLFPPGKGLCT